MTVEDFTSLRLPNLRYWRELAIFALMIMELSWIVPWYRSLTPMTYAASIWKVFFVLLGILLLAHFSTRLMNFLNIKIRIRRIVTLILLILAIFLGLKLLLYEMEAVSFDALLNRPFRAFSDVRGLIPDEFLVIVVVMVVYWRGLVLASKFIDPMSVRGNFYLGLVMFVAYIFINTLVTGETPGAMLYIFFVSGLVAMGAARIFTITQLRGGARNPFDLRWFMGILLTTLGIVGLAAFMAWLVSDRTSILGGIGGLVLGIFGGIMLVLISPLIFIMERFADSVPQASGAVQSVVNALEDLRNTFSTIANNLFTLFNIPSLMNWMQLMKPVLLWVFVIAIALTILFSVSHWLSSERRADLDEREGIIERGDILGLLRRAIQERLENLGGSLRGRARVKTSQRWLVAARIRRIYASMMDLATQLGEPRPLASTPLEFQPVMEHLLPEGKEDVGLITAAYLRVRYGEIPETEAEIKQVETAWEHLRSIGREKKNEATKSKKGLNQPQSKLD
ncbi:MAG: DUF4129 domain-containing protein [Anaerolineales bacterium]